MVSSVDAYFDSDYVYSGPMAFAFGLTAYDSNPERIEDPSYGLLKAYYKSWGIHGTFTGVHREELTTKPCTHADLQIFG